MEDPQPARLAAAAVLARVERRSRVLRATRQRHDFRLAGRLLIRSPAPGDGVPALGAVPSPPDGEVLRLPGDQAATVRLALAAGEIRFTKLSGGPVRLRAFYPDAAVSTVVHTRSTRRPGRLAGAARVVRALQPVAHLTVPRLLDAGALHRADWWVEDLLAGRHPGPAEAADVATRLLPALLSTARRAGLGDDPVGSWTTPGTLDAVMLMSRAVLTDDPAAPGPAAWERLGGVLSPEGRLAVGPCHGDPVMGNVLMVQDGSLALLDWELAGWMPVAHDVAKVLTAVEDPTCVIDTCAPDLAALDGGGRLPWREQVAVALCRQSAGWVHQRTVAEASSRLRPLHRRAARRLGLLRLLLDV